jgi:hypothetical protein
MVKKQLFLGEYIAWWVKNSDKYAGKNTLFLEE